MYRDVNIDVEYSGRGATGPKGDTGNTGLMGPKGEKGDKGDQGDTGPQGVAGPVGPIGAQGPIGPEGATGAIGATGPQGSTGPTGLTGATGATGPQGIPGNTGPQGPQGLQGAKGDKGDTGDTGPQGTQGPQGATGPTGSQGVQGPIGPEGPLGPVGPAGPTGPQGDVGPQGPQGLPGAGSTSDAPYGPAWNGVGNVSPSQNAIYDKLESIIAGSGSVSDTAYGTGWNGVVNVSPSQNAVFDKIEAVVASIPAAPSTVISDAVYGAGWNGVAGIAPSQNAVFDKIEALTVTINGKAAAVHTHAISEIVDLQTQLDTKLNASQKGAINGVASLGADGKLTATQMPTVTVAWGGITGSLASQTDLTAALNAKLDDSQAGTFGLTMLGQSTQASAKTSLGLVKADVGLANVDNTSDANKPVSTAQQTALNAKQDTIVAGTAAQYYRGDKVMATLDVAAVGGLSTALSGKADAATLGNYLPLIGGTLTGNINITKADPYIALTDGAGQHYIHGNASYLLYKTNGAHVFSTDDVQRFSVSDGGIAVSGNINLSGATNGFVLNDRDGSGAFQIYNQADTLRLHNGSGDVFTIDTNGIVTTNGSTIWVGGNKLVVQHDGSNGFIRSQVGALTLGAGGANRLFIQADGNAIYQGNYTIQSTNGATDGGIGLIPGGSANTGYIAFYAPGGARAAYIGYADVNNLNIVPEGGRTLLVSGNLTAGGTISTTGGSAGIYVNDRDGSGTFLIYNNNNLLRFHDGATGDKMSLSPAGDLSAGGSIYAANNLTAGNRIIGKELIIQGGTTEGGQIVLGYKGMTAITAGDIKTWNIDVTDTDQLRAYRIDAAGAAGEAFTINPTNLHFVSRANVYAQTDRRCYQQGTPGVGPGAEIYMSTGAPSSGDGNNGDIWLQYT